MVVARSEPSAGDTTEPPSGPGGRWPAWAPWALLAGLVAARAIAVVVLLRSGIQHEHTVLGGDARRYIQILTGPGTPYRDFAVEYPPVTLGLTWLVHWGSVLTTIALLAVSQLLLELATAAVLAWAWTRRTALTYLVLGTPMIFFPFPYVRIDLLSVFLAVLGVALLRRRHDVGGGTTLAVAVFAKVWPLALGPLLFVRRRWRGAAAWVAAGAVGLVSWVAWAGTNGIDQVITFRGAKGWQIESIPGILLHMSDPSRSHVEQGAWRTGAAMPWWSRPLLTAATVAVVAVAWWLAAQVRSGRRDAALEGYAPLLAVLAMLVFSSIISPQYVLWFVPWAAIATVHGWDRSGATGRGDLAVGALTLLITAVTTYELATIHWQIHGALWATLPVLARDLLLVALGVVCLIRLRRAREPQSQLLRLK